MSQNAERGRTMAKLIKAPHAKEHLNTPPQQDIFILAGSEAWIYYGVKEQKGDGLWQLIKSSYDLPANYKPIILDDDKLNNITKYQLADKNHQSFVIFECGKVTERQKTALCLNLATNTNAQAVKFYPCGEFDKYENLNPHHAQSGYYFDRIRKGESVAELVANTIEETTAYSEYFDKLKANRKTDEFLKWLNTPLRYNDNNQMLYLYNGKKWDSLEDIKISRLIRDFFREKEVDYSKRKIDAIAELLPNEAPLMGKANNNLLAFSNGVLNKNTGEFLNHSEEHFLTSFINIDYSPENLSTPNFNKWLEWTSENDEQKKMRILAGLYAVLTNRYEWQMFLEITGSGGTGKTIFSIISKMLVGEENCEAVTLKGLEEMTILVSLIDKSLFYAEDQARYIGEGGALKTITGGGDVAVRALYKKPFSTTIQAMFLMTNNQPAILISNDGSITRRRVIYRFDKVIPFNKRDTSLAEKLKAEIGGIANLLIRTFQNPETARQLLEEQRASSEALEVKHNIDPVMQFSEHFKTIKQTTGLKIGSRSYLSKNGREAHRVALFNAYHLFCDCEEIPQHKRMTKRTFIKALSHALKELNNEYDFKIGKKDNTQITNVIYKDANKTFDEWTN